MPEPPRRLAAAGEKTARADLRKPEARRCEVEQFHFEIALAAAGAGVLKTLRLYNLKVNLFQVARLVRFDGPRQP